MKNKKAKMEIVHGSGQEKEPSSSAKRHIQETMKNKKAKMKVVTTSGQGDGSSSSYRLQDEEDMGITGVSSPKEKKKKHQKKKKTEVNNSTTSGEREDPSSTKGTGGADFEKATKKAKKERAKTENVTTPVPGEEPSSDGVKTESVPEPVGMQVYWNLSSVDGYVREAATVALVRELIGAQKDYEDKGMGQEETAAEAVILGVAKTLEDGLKDCAPAVQYALRRLIRGVASSRESARQGFSLALAAVLGALPCINGAAVVKLIEKHLEVTSSMKGMEARDALLGQLFAYAALVRSSKAIGDARTPEQQELAKGVTQQLLTLAKKKIFLREPAIYALVELGEKLEVSGLEKGVCAAPLLLESLKEDPESFTPDALFLALRLHKKLPKSILQSCPLIPESGNLLDIFDKDHLLHLVPCLKESSNCHPRVHSLWDSLLQILFSESAPQSPIKKNKKRRSSENETSVEVRLVTFWTVVVDGSLLTSSHERKHLAIQLLLLILPRLPAPSYIQHILSNNFVQCLLGACTSKENLLYKSAQNCITELCKWAELDEECRIRAVIALQQSTQGKFDHFSRTQSIKSLMKGLTTISGYQSAFQAFSSLYLRGRTLGDTGNSVSSSKKQKSPAEDLEHDSNDMKKDEDAGQERWVVDQLRALCQHALVGLPANVATEELIAKFVPSLTPVQPFTEDEEESVATLQSTMLQVSSALPRVEPGEQKDRLQAMLSLLVQLLFESRLAPSVATETASEISICCKKAFGDLVQLEVESDGEDGDTPAFMDVLVDVLLSLLAQPSAPIRAAADQVFKSFSGDLTSSGLTDLLRIVKKNTQSTRHKPVVVVDDQKDDDEDILDVEESDENSAEDKDEGEDVDSDESGTDDVESDEEDGKVQAAVEKVEVPSKRKHSKSRAADVDEESEASDLDDEAMFKMDKHLESMLKQRKQGGADGTEESKDAQTQLMHFKFRVLALLDFFLQKHSGSMLVLTMLPSLLHVFVNSCTTDGNSRVADRVSAILQNKLFKGKQYPKGPEVDRSSLKVLLRKALKLASRSTVQRVGVMAQSACYWILKVINGNLDEAEDKDVVEMFSAALEEFFINKKCRLSSAFFKETFLRNPWLGSCLLGDLLEKVMTARSEYLRYEALLLVGTILGFKTGKSHKKASLSPGLTQLNYLDPHLSSVSKVILHVLKEFPSVKVSHRIEGLKFCISALELHQTLYPNKSLVDFCDPDDYAAALKLVTAPANSKLGNLVLKLQQLEVKSRKAT